MPALAHIKKPTLPVSPAAPDLPLDTAAPKAPLHLHTTTGSPFRRRRGPSAPRPPLSARTRQERAARLPQKPAPAKPTPTRTVAVNESAIRALRAARAAAGGTSEAKEQAHVDKITAEVKAEASARKAAGQPPTVVQQEGAKIKRSQSARTSRFVQGLRSIAAVARAPIDEIQNQRGQAKMAKQYQKARAQREAEGAYNPLDKPPEGGQP